VSHAAQSLCDAAPARRQWTNAAACAGMFAIRAERDYVVEDDFMRAARKIAETKKLESKLEYGKI